MRCDAALYLLLEVIANPKNDTANNTPNTKANILNSSLSTKTHHAAYSSCTEYNNFTDIPIVCVPLCQEQIDKYEYC